MTLETAIAIGSSLGFIIAGVAACYERFRSRKREDAVAKREDAVATANALVSDRDAWKSLYAAGMTEIAAYREKAHAIQGEANAKILSLTEENAKLKGATDLTPVLQHQTQQNEINTKILSSLDMIMDHLRSLRPCTKKKAKGAKP